MMRMTELGKELLEAMQNDEWGVSKHKMHHKGSGVVLWIANGFSHFRIYEVDKTALGETALHDALNYHDRVVLWETAKSHLENLKRHPAATTLNILRLARQHKEN